MDPHLPPQSNIKIQVAFQVGCLLYKSVCVCIQCSVHVHWHVTHQYSVLTQCIFMGKVCTFTLAQNSKADCEDSKLVGSKETTSNIPNLSSKSFHA